MLTLLFRLNETAQPKVGKIWSALAGTLAASFRIGFTGPRLKDVFGVLAIRNAADSADANLTVLDEAYGAGWNGSSQVPTKNAVYDKIETLGGSTVTSAVQTAATRNETATNGQVAIFCNCTSNAITINLPTAVGNTAVFHVKKTDSSANAITIDPATTETIDGESTITISTQYDAVTLISDGSNWGLF